MNKRIVEIRKRAKLTQESFAKRMNISKNYVTLIETGRKTPGDRLLSDICREFNVNEDWLRTGTGEMFVPVSENKELSDFLEKIMDLPEGDFRKRFALALSKLDQRDWETLEKLTSELSETAASEDVMEPTTEDLETEYKKSVLDSVSKKESTALSFIGDKEAVNE